MELCWRWHSHHAIIRLLLLLRVEKLLRWKRSVRTTRMDEVSVRERRDLQRLPPLQRGICGVGQAASQSCIVTVVWIAIPYSRDHVVSWNGRVGYAISRHLMIHRRVRGHDDLLNLLLLHANAGRGLHPVIRSTSDLERTIPTDSSPRGNSNRLIKSSNVVPCSRNRTHESAHGLRWLAQTANKSRYRLPSLLHSPINC